MSANDSRQIKVGPNRIGIIGLKQALNDLARISDSMTEDQIKKHLMETLGKKNYISEKVKDLYEAAFYREFCLHTGRPVEQDNDPGLIEIKVLGQGCARCDQLEHDVITIVAEMNIPSDVEHVRDIKAIAEYGVMGSPALVINGQVKVVGTVPGKQKIMAWINEVNENKINK
jgi:small redox-active disulfide protein 2